MEKLLTRLNASSYEDALLDPAGGSNASLKWAPWTAKKIMSAAKANGHCKSLRETIKIIRKRDLNSEDWEDLEFILEKAKKQLKKLFTQSEIEELAGYANEEQDEELQAISVKAMIDD